MTDKRRGRGERDDHIAKVIPLRRPNNLADQLANDLNTLVHRAGATFTELVATADEQQLELPRAARSAARLLLVGLLEEASPSNVTWATDMRDGCEPEELADALQGLSVGRATLDELEQRVAGFGQELPSTPPLQLRGPIHDHLGRVRLLLTRPQPVRVRGRLCSAAAQLAGIAGAVMFDLHQPVKAQGYYDAAMLAAVEAGDPALAAWLLANTSYLHVYRGNERAALDAAQGAVTFGRRCTITTQHAWLASLEAELHATLADRCATEAALRRADRAMRLACTEARRPGIDFFSLAKLSAYKGSCFMLLGQPTQAREHCQEALALLSPAAHTRAFVELDLATTFAQQREVERACDVARETLTRLGPDERTPRLVRRVQDFRRSLDRNGSARSVRDLDEEFQVAFGFRR
jgi:tetratricopeptide (TPR) repeat protein